jgi:hypothetical protein
MLTVADRRREDGLLAAVDQRRSAELSRGTL